jgi:NAD(P)H-dependent flavin oxidoreductase YrpB (nitropropane dioxygenase family)
MTASISPLHTPICDRLGITYPIFGFNHSIDVTVEVCKAGGIGIYGATRRTPEEIRTELAEIRSRVGDRPFGVDLVLPQGMPARNNREVIEAALPDEHRAFVEHLHDKYDVPRGSGPGMRSRFVRSEEVADRQIDAVLESDVNVFAMGVGSPPAAIAAARDSGKLIVSLVGSPKHARRVKDLGVDIIVAQGYDAGAHTGTIGTFSLLPQVVDIAGEVPVLAAGGVVTGRHIAAAFAMGAAGVWVGTAWLFTRENHTNPIILDKLIAAGAEDTVISRADSGKTLRQIRTTWSDEWAATDAPTPLKMPFQDILIGDLLGAIDQHQVVPLMHSPAGQGVGVFDRETTVADVMAGFVREAEAAIARMRAM